ncbi:MAG TPA: MBL fold metallo-hydrolase [Vicinamibacterales bacterium]|nr:MBL fold metallo-hydrolase [Vicinamibacterales bacterium]
MFIRFFDEGLAQASFIVGCDRTRQAVVIDPRRDASVYLEAARQQGAALTAAIETHVHADFVSGAHELASAGVRVISGPGSALGYDHHEVVDRERLQVGDVALTFLHTPGHTPEHIAILSDAPGNPSRLFTGDLLFVGAVGRPDLLGTEQTKELAHQLYASLNRVMQLNGDVEVQPGHGAGSLCGAGIGKEPSSTIAIERRQNPMLQFTSESAFVDAVLGDLPDTPPYFARMKQVNKDGAPLLGLVNGPRVIPAIKPAAAAALAADGALLIDLRPPAAFAESHPYGAVNLGFGSKVGFCGGWVLPPDEPMVLVAPEPSQAQEAAMQLLRVGLDRVHGHVAGGFDAWREAALPVASIDLISAADLKAELSSNVPLTLIDVRTGKEWRAGHVEGAVNIPLGDLPSRLAEIPRGARVATMCEGGYRSSLAASLLAREGFAPVLNVEGGMSAYRALEAT